MISEKQNSTPKEQYETTLSKFIREESGGSDEPPADVSFELVSEIDYSPLHPPVAPQDVGEMTPLLYYRSGASGCEPAIKGTGVTVRAIVELHRLYHDVDQIRQSIPHVTQEQIKAALNYYAAHQSEIDYHIQKNKESYQQKLQKKWETTRKKSSSPST